MARVHARICCWALVCVLTLLVLPVQASQPLLPAVDFAAMQTAMNIPQGQHAYPVASSYAHFLKARLAHYNGAHSKAINELHLAQATDGDNPLLQTALAGEYICLAQVQWAEHLLTQIITHHPSYAPAQLLLGRVLYSTSLLQAHWLRTVAKDLEAYRLSAQLLLQAGRVDDAVRMRKPKKTIGFDVALDAPQPIRLSKK